MTSLPSILDGYVPAIATIAAALVCLCWHLLSSRTPAAAADPRSMARVQVLSVLGSGGHTTEMLALCSALSTCDYTITYAAAHGDTASISKLHSVINKNQINHTDLCVDYLPRARVVAQSWLTTPLTTLLALPAAFFIVWRRQPHIILCNGPGTCIPICIAAKSLSILRLARACRMIYVESFACVEHMSLSGRIFYHLRLGNTYVQWPELRTLYPRAIYEGILV